MQQSTITLAFCRSKGWQSALIRAATWSPWSHVALVYGDQVVDAQAPKGVRCISLAGLQEESSRIDLVRFPCVDPEMVIAAALGQVGKPYDWGAVLGIGIHRNWAESDKWFCSELVAWAFARAGQPLFRPDSISRITPQHLWMLPPASAVL